MLFRSVDGAVQIRVSVKQLFRIEALGRPEIGHAKRLFTTLEIALKSGYANVFFHDLPILLC